ncbi:MAG TPA: fatty acid desaturase [Actinospica sp.]|nr:fatty acid desaturase [Actinospica sp.]
MQIWRTSRKDSLLAAISAAQFAVTLVLALSWAGASPAARAAGGVLLTLMMTYNIIVVSHLFTHMPWFVSPRLNALVSLVNSVNIGQSVQAYQLTHVRNHHRFNNDRPGPDGTTLDSTSTYYKGKNGRHRPLPPYAVGGAVDSLYTRLKDTAAVVRLWKVGSTEERLLSLASRREQGRSRELRQVQADRAVLTVFLALFAAISWQWTLFCYLPAFFAALTLVNVQNYYRHFGANPDARAADSVSHYSRIYNFFTFNDGFHQEHHLSPSSHWSSMPDVRARQQNRLDAQPRIVSPVPAMLGFLHRSRPQLHLDPDAANRAASRPC